MQLPDTESKAEWNRSCERRLRSLTWTDTQFYTIQLCVEKFAFWRVIYIKTFNKINTKTSTTQWNTELKTAQIQGKYFNNVHTHTHARTHARTLPPTHQLTANSQFLARKIYRLGQWRG